jgi:hypothetical protein
MTSTINHSTCALVVAFVSVVAIVLPVQAVAAEPPVKEIISSHVGWEVDKTTKGEICTTLSEHECQPGKPSSEPDGFEFALSISTDSAPAGDVYTADSGNHRVQEFTATGEFLSMFGKEVNGTTHGDVCTASSGDTCKAGVEGMAPGQFGALQSVSVDPTNGDVYVAEIVFGSSGGKPLFGERVQKFTPGGVFILEIGKEVNETTKGNFCTQEEAEKGTICTGPALTSAIEGKGEPGGVFAFGQGNGNLLAVGGPEDLLYVGDERRVQEFETDGKYKGEILLAAISSAPGSRVSAIAADKAGNVYLAYEVKFAASVVREFDQSGKEIREFPMVPREPNGSVSIGSLALDAGGRLAVTEVESGHRGALYEIGPTSLHLITEFFDPGLNDIAFGGKGELYAVIGHEALIYSAVPVAELVTVSSLCSPGVEHETDATLNCELRGGVNPEKVPETEVWFQWGSTIALGSETLKVLIPPGETREPVSAEVQGLRPNETFYYQVAGYDQNVKAPEVLTSERTSLTTPSVPPRVVGPPSVSFVHSSSAVMFGELNPENMSTTYAFEYGSCGESVESCSEVGHTETLESDAYGRIGVTLEATGLQPSTTYRYRLIAVNGHKQESQCPGSGCEGSFTTAPAPVPQATTGEASAINTNTATVLGTVNPDGKPATYTFELGLSKGAATQYGVLFSGPAGSGTVPITETLALSGLQPGTEYAYRVTVKSGYGESRGAVMTFRTAGLPMVLSSPQPLAMLPSPEFGFPKTGRPPLTDAQKLTIALKACKAKPKERRRSCRRKARERYGRKGKKKK